ncbi:MAG: sulfotransferase [Planctomycetaceae bacterium]|nr:sulfotransferase [Planctomycetaceae bacterium]
MSTATQAPQTPTNSLPTSGGKTDFIDASFNVPWGVHVLSGLVSRFPRLWKSLAKLESLALREQLEGVSIDRPIYIAGIARSGSTILLEALAAHSVAATHQYRDFPMLFTPYWWSQTHSKQPSLPVERAHGDGLMVTPESPEAMEEVFWQAYFTHAHDPHQCQVLDRSTSHPAFEQFYRDHLRKLLHLRGGSRYVSKGNYNFSRMAYLHTLFPDARFVVPIRRPEAHIASLMKQQRLFEAGETKYPRALAQMQRIGHYEFGLDRRPINVGNTDLIREVEQLWKSGEAVRGWARYWSHLYGWMADQLDSDPLLRHAAQIIRYEDLCAAPAAVLNRMRTHCQLGDDAKFAAFAGQIHAPDYYCSKFTDAEQQAITEETAATAARYGYES